MQIAVIIQARLGSTRLPGKTFLPLGKKKNVLEQVISRLNFFLPISQIIIATTVHIKDKEIINFCKEKSYPYFIGSENDVLDRYYQTAKKYNIEHIVRVGADSPLIDPELLKIMQDIYFQGEYDYLSNTLEDSYPEGLNAEFFSFQSLEKAWLNAKLPSEREHVTPYIKKSSKFKKYSLVSPINYKDKRWTLDYLEDYNFITAIYKELEDKQPYFTTQDILNLLQQKPNLEKLNAHIIRNEGYIKSLKEEQ